MQTNIQFGPGNGRVNNAPDLLGPNAIGSSAMEKFTHKNKSDHSISAGIRHLIRILLRTKPYLTAGNRNSKKTVDFHKKKLYDN
jgi:hypothetical protein